MASSASHSVASLVLAQKVVTKWKKMRDDKEKTSFFIDDANAVSCGQSWGQNARCEIFFKQGKLKEKQERRTEKQFKKWELFKSKIASARLGDVLSGVNFYLGRKRYSVLKQLGEGPHSKVFEVYDEEKNIFALKIVNLTSTGWLRKQLMREIVYLEKLRDCKRVVQALEFELLSSEEDEFLLVLMERGDADLANLINKHREDGTLTSSRVRFYWEQMLEAVQEVHSHGILHADIKPANFLLVSGELKIIDFGLSSDMQPGTESVVRQFIGGTREYMSPEIYSSFYAQVYSNSSGGILVTTKSDIWALGVILYQAVCGSLPFSSVSHLVDSKFKVNLENVDDVWLRQVLECTLARDPDLRPGVTDLLSHQFIRPRTVQKILCTDCRDMELFISQRGKKGSGLISDRVRSDQ